MPRKWGYMRRKTSVIWTGLIIICLTFVFPSTSWAEFVDNGDGTVTDTVTGLLWQRGDTHNDTKITWQDALSYCYRCNLAGYQDWRLPNIREMESIVDLSRYDPAIDPIFDSQPSKYWSSSTCADIPNKAWNVYFYIGSVESQYKGDESCYVRCVRGGPEGTFKQDFALQGVMILLMGE